ncbi:hypothetical protein [Mesorhizobium australicum]|uniref:Uncharacterized protein n=1 Tax=Mesorhizobium australicum TaxID=536018 RepID=A0A1X7NWF3_9HYPH|nr:hypothetical protein [Mesorhizobium australicum]SMH42212.1 hypothetical protein SAMN02982922_2711 [Mesorhizobium australicum]
MAARSDVDIVDLKLRVPRGGDGLWKLLLEIDRVGPWTKGQVAARTAVSTARINQFVDRLLAAGIATISDEGACRLTRRPTDAPRLRLDGSELPEDERQILWRTMKMLKTFSPRELAAQASSDERAIGLETTRSFINRMAQVGIVGIVQVPSRRGEGKYRLARNLGALAPRILSVSVVFDPNAVQVIGDAEASEVSR